MLYLLARWLILTLAIGVTIYIFPGMAFRGSFWELFMVSLIFALVNAIIRPIVTLLTCPLVILTLGLFTLVINALMLMLTAWLVPAFNVDGFFTALFGSIVISIVSAVLNLFVHDRSDL